MGLIVAVEAARTQLRLALFDTSELQAAYGRTPEFKALTGVRWDLDEELRTGSFTSSISAQIEQIAAGHEADLVGLGIAVTGSVTLGDTVHLIYSQPYRQVEFSGILNSLRRKYPTLENNMIVDSRSHLGAWGEYHYGWRPILVRDRRDLLFITISSGIGGGIVINNELLRGVKGIAGDIGHIVIDPESEYECSACNQKGCVSELASGRALVRDVMEHKDAGGGGLTRIISATTGDARDPDLIGVEGGAELLDVGYRGTIDIDRTAEEFDARSVLRAWSSGSPLAQEAVNRMATSLAKLITELAYVLDPSIVVLGGIAAAAPELAVVIDQRIHLRPYASEGHILRTSRLGDRAALYGAALLASGKTPRAAHQPEQ